MFQEIKLSNKKFLVSKTDTKGIILYANEYFSEVSGYSEVELIGKPHNIVRHPDMPKAIFYLLWEDIKRGKNISAVVKNRTKNGDYYWVVTDFEILKDSMGNVTEYIAYRSSISQQVIDEIEPLYKKLKDIEEQHGMKVSVDYIKTFLHEKGMSYNAYIEGLAAPKGLSAKLFNAMKKLFQ